MKLSTNNPLVSIIIPVYNGAHTIDRCLKSLMDQSYPKDKIEVIVVDNNSKDNTAELVFKYNVKFMEEKKKGPSAARNTGVRIARGEIIIFTDADCIADKDFVHEHIKMHLYFQNIGKDYKVIGGAIEGYNENYWSTCDDFMSWHPYFPELSPREETFHPTANLSLYRSICHNEGVSFDENFINGDDVAFCAILEAKGYKIYFHPSAKIQHINRTTFKDFMNHSLHWSRGELDLRKKGYRKHRPKSPLLWFVFHIRKFFIMIGYFFLHSIEARRFHVFFYFPAVVWNILIWSWQLLKADLKYNSFINSYTKNTSSV